MFSLGSWRISPPSRTVPISRIAAVAPAIIATNQGVAFLANLPLDMILPTLSSGTTDATEIEHNVVPSPAPKTDRLPDTTLQQPPAGTTASSVPGRRIVLSPAPSASKGTQHRLNWHKHTFANWKQLGITLTKLYWLIRRKQNYPQATNFSYIKRYSNQSGLTKYNSGVRLPLPT
jgi:hypothetical protein